MSRFRPIPGENLKFPPNWERWEGIWLLVINGKNRRIPAGVEGRFPRQKGCWRAGGAMCRTRSVCRRAAGWYCWDFIYALRETWAVKRNFLSNILFDVILSFRLICLFYISDKDKALLKTCSLLVDLYTFGDTWAVRKSRTHFLECLFLANIKLANYR